MFTAEMTTVQRLNRVLKEKHIQKKTFAETIGIPASTLNSWINRGGEIPSSFAVPIAKALDVSLTWLLTGEESQEKEIPESFVELNEEEMYLVRVFRSLDWEGKVVVANRAVEEKYRLFSEQPAM